LKAKKTAIILGATGLTGGILLEKLLADPCILKLNYSLEILWI